MEEIKESLKRIEGLLSEILLTMRASSKVCVLPAAHNLPAKDMEAGIIQALSDVDSIGRVVVRQRSS